MSHRSSWSQIDMYIIREDAQQTDAKRRGLSHEDVC